VYTPCPIAFADLLDALGQQLAAGYSNTLEAPLPESLAHMARQLSSEQNVSLSESAE